MLPITKLYRFLFGYYCHTHDLHYKSDLCPGCVKQRIVDAEVKDARREWVKSEGSWPLRVGNKST